MSDNIKKIRTDGGHELDEMSSWPKPPGKIPNDALALSGSIPDIPAYMSAEARAKMLQKPKKKKSCKDICRRMVKIIFSSLGSLLMVVAYLVLGGYLFIYLEQQNEQNACDILSESYQSALNNTVQRLMSFAIISVGNDTLLEINMKTAASDFAAQVYSFGFDPSADCSTLGTADNNYQWNLFNTMYFCATIMTTIGYGHICPATNWGKIVCMVYAILGIPIMLVFLSKVGDALTRFFILSYYNLCCCKCFLKSLKIKEAIVMENPENNNSSIKQIENVEGIVVIEEQMVLTEFVEQEDIPEFTIPITVTLIFIVVYMLCGARFFQIWETDWTMLEGAYFAFITMATIGFGDYVPGRNAVGKDSTNIELILATVYSVAGLAILTMSITLIQESMTAKFDWIASKMGLSKEEDMDANQSQEMENMHSDAATDTDYGSRVNLTTMNQLN